MFRIETKLQCIQQNEVVQYRRLVTPLFYVNLKTRTFTRLAEITGYIAFVQGIMFKYHPWEDGKGKEASYDLRQDLEKANTISKVVKFPSEAA